MKFSEMTIEWLADRLKDHKFVHDGWFFPSDIIPHSLAFKRRLKKLFEEGKLERQGNKSDRWGYRYKIR